MRGVIIALLLVGLLISCTHKIETTNQIDVETDMQTQVDFVEQIDDSFIGEEEYIEIGELI